MTGKMHDLLISEDGGVIAEYGMIAVLVSIAAVAALILLGGTVKTFYEGVISAFR